MTDAKSQMRDENTEQDKYRNNYMRAYLVHIWVCFL